MNDAMIVFIYVADSERAATFYRAKLGLELVLEQAHCKFFRIADGGYLGVCQSEDRPVTPDGMVITLVRNDVDEYCAQLQERGVEFEQPPKRADRFGIYNAFLRDPDGHLIEVQRFDDPKWNEPIS